MRFVKVEIVEHIPAERIPFPVPKDTITEYVAVVFESDQPEPVIQIKEIEIEKPADCGPVTVDGTCELWVAGDDELVKSAWWANVKGNGWVYSKGRTFGKTLAMKTKESTTPKWQRWWLASVMRVNGNWGALTGPQLQHRKLGSLSLQVGGLQVPEASAFFLDSEQTSISLSTSAEPVYLVQYGRRF
jgi:hypothetical protein